MTHRDRPARRWLLFTGAAAAAAVTFSSLMPADAATSKMPASSNWNRHWQQVAGAGLSGGPMTLTKALGLAATNDAIMSTEKVLGPYVKQMKAANPRLRIFVYLDAATVKKGEVAHVPKNWLSVNSKGQLIYSTVWGNALTNPFDPGWRAEVVNRCKQRLASSGYDACYIDDLNSGFLGTMDSRPVDPKSKKQYTDQQWESAMLQLLGGVRTAVGAAALLGGNGINNGPTYFEPDGTKKLFTYLDQGTAECYLRCALFPINRYRSEAEWLDEVRMLTDAGSNGKTLFSWVKVLIPATATQKLQWRKYGQATFLMGTNGFSYYGFLDTTRAGLPTPSKYDTANVGTALGPMTKVGGGYIRKFSNGVAVVNPTGGSTSIALGGTYKTPDGKSYSSITLPGYSGEILTK